MDLRRLAKFRSPNAQSDLGVFTGPWARIVDAVEAIAKSHHQFAERVEKDVEQPLRVFQQRKDVVNMNTISNNLATMAKTLEDARDKSDKIGKRGGKASAQKADAASSKLDSATQQWESQAPFVFESLQAFDESRINQLRDLLTQYQTHETDCAQRNQESSATALAQVLEVSTETEVQAFANKATLGKAKLPIRTSTRRSSTAGTPTSTGPPSTGGSAVVPPPAIQAIEPQPEREEPAPLPDRDVKESKLRRLGTMFGGRRRQSIHGAIGMSPQKAGSFGRLTNKERPGISPRASSGNLQESSRLGALSEVPNLPRTPEQDVLSIKPQPRAPANGSENENIMDSPIPTGVNGAQESGVMDAPQTVNQPPTAQPQTSAPPTKDAEGFTIPPTMNDPISEAQREAAGDEDQPYKLNIQNKPVEDEDPEAKQAALSNVYNSLKMGPATRRQGTIRGRRDVRHTIYAPAPSSEGYTDSSPMPGIPGSPPFNTSPSFASSLAVRPPAFAALASEGSVAGASDNQSVRSGNSLGSLAHSQAKHPEMSGAGLHSSIIETVSAVFEDGVVGSASIAGEIAFVNNPSDTNELKSKPLLILASENRLNFPAHETIRINNFTILERIGPNRIFVQNSPTNTDQFTLDTSHIPKTSPAFSYRVFGSPTDLAHSIPLVLNASWKPQGDKLGLLLQYSLNPAWKNIITLHNVVFVASYEGNASGAQTKPSGTHLKDRHLVYWRLGDIALSSEPQKIVCRVVGVEGVEPQQGHVEARWEYHGDKAGSGISISRLEEGKGKAKEIAEDDPFADDTASGDTWVDVPLVRKLVSGRYEGR